MPLRLSKNRVLLDGIPLNESQAANLASAATLDIWSVTGNVIPITGTATISAFTAAPQAGTRRTLLCTGTPTFTHSTNLLLPGSADYTATAGDRIEVLAVTTTQFRLSLLQTSVLNFATKSLFPTTGAANVLYRDRATGLVWSWDAGGGAYGQPLAALSLDASGNATGIASPTASAPYGYALLPLDVNGYAVGNIIPRRNTLANLLLLAGGVGELSEATDWDALVLHNGVVGGAKVFSCKKKRCRVVRDVNNQLGVASAAQTKLTFETAVDDNYTMWNVSNPGDIVLPSGCNTFSAKGGAAFGVNATSSTGRRSLFFRVGGVAGSMGGGGSIPVNSLTENTNASGRSAVTTTTIPTSVTMYCYQNSGNPLDIVASSMNTWLEVEAWVE